MRLFTKLSTATNLNIVRKHKDKFYGQDPAKVKYETNPASEHGRKKLPTQPA